MTPKYVLITESALDAALVSAAFSETLMLPSGGPGVHEFWLGNDLVGYRVAGEPHNPVFALIRVELLNFLKGHGGIPSDIYRRIARVVKGLKSLPVHLPRQWSEYHHKNLLAFFALSRDISNDRWVADIDGGAKCVRFDHLTFDDAEVDLTSYTPDNWPDNYDVAVSELLSKTVKVSAEANFAPMAQEVDLRKIGSGSIVNDRTFEIWRSSLTDAQKAVVENNLDASIRIVGPAGSGKTLAICMRAIQVSRDLSFRAKGKRLLVATHSWAMCERIDGVLSTLNGGSDPDGITVFPLLSLLELHAGHIGQKKTDVIGDDSTDGRLK